MAVNAAPSLFALKKGADLLFGAGLLKPEQHQAVLQQCQRMNVRSEEAILELGLMTEQDLLKALANQYKTHFISSEKLAAAQISRTMLEVVPRKVAERYNVFPVLFDADANSLSVVSADPDDLEVMHEIALVSGARDVRVILARPLAVKAAIARHYGGEKHAFAFVDRLATAAMKGMGDALHARERVVSERDLTKPTKAPPVPPPLPPRALAQQAQRAQAGRPTPQTGTIKPTAQPPPPPPAPPQGWTCSGESVLELLNVLVSVVENSRQELRGHSAAVSRLARRLGERINLPKDALIAVCATALIHDLGKMGQFHLTALNASEYEGHKVAAQKSHDTPVRLLEAAKLQPDALNGVLHMYEHYDGSGFPDGLAGKEIPLASRIVALTDTYADLTQNTRNPYRKILPPADAFAVLDKFKETIFDPHLVDLFRAMMMGEDVRAKLLSNRSVALLVDADPEETTVLELRMIEQGFEVKIARTIADAMRVLAQGDVDLVVSEVEMSNGDGLALLAESRKHPWGKDLPWVMHTRKQGRVEAQRAFELGVLDYASKLAPTDVFVAKLKALLDQRASAKGPRGVSGSLDEMALPDLVQVLWHGRKTGNLRIRNGADAAEIHFHDGSVVNATWGALAGAEAFYALLRQKRGDFAFDADFKPKERAIAETTETLLLEGMRRLDEGID